MTVPSIDFFDHVVIIGWNPFSRAITNQLLTAGKRIVVLTDDRNSYRLISERYSHDTLRVVFCEYDDLEVFQQINADKAAMLLVNLGGDTENLVHILRLRRRFHRLNILAPIINANLRNTFLNAGVVYPLSKNEMVAKLFASFMFERDVAVYIKDLLSASTTEASDDIRQFPLRAGNAWCGRTYGELFVYLRKQYKAALIGMSVRNLGKDTLMKNPPAETLLPEGSNIIAIANGKEGCRMAEEFGGRKNPASSDRE